MLTDRHYMRRPSFRPLWSTTGVLLAINVAVFVLELARYGSRLVFPADDYFALSVGGLRHGYVWQLATYQFMHGGWLHLLLNCWAIYVFGREVESALGRKRYLALYLGCGVMGGLAQALAGVLAGGLFGGPVVGASAGAFGLIAAFAMLYPERPLTLLLFFIIPVTLRARMLLLFLGGLTLIGIATAFLPLLGIAFPPDNIAHAAHLGGMLTGMAFVRYAAHWQWPRLRQGRGERVRPLVQVLPGAAGRRGGSRMAVEEDLPAEEFLSREVDPILDKISAQGIQSLTERERRVLERAREKMAGR
jgi:membrane associated rhomboid family serine protease